MEDITGLRALRAGLVVVAMLLPGEALAFDLTGAWTSDSALCDKVFEKKGGAVEFAELSDLYGAGFIVNGNAIRAKSGKCTIKSQRQDGDKTVLSASCASSIMTSELQFNYKVVDDNTLIRDFPEIKDMTLKYSRCPM
ncbi:MAG TPA: hypothetical protein VKY22_29210 [Bradyrhizobium sp.]|jgi:hypothetical protein|nr:hypothetical protein [Bradyrhizobium sp.]